MVFKVPNCYEREREREREREPEPENLGLMGLPWLTWGFLLSRKIWCINKFYNKKGKTTWNPLSLTSYRSYGRRQNKGKPQKEYQRLKKGIMHHLNWSNRNYMFKEEWKKYSKVLWWLERARGQGSYIGEKDNWMIH